MPPEDVDEVSRRVHLRGRRRAQGSGEILEDVRQAGATARSRASSNDRRAMEAGGRTDRAGRRDSPEEKAAQDLRAHAADPQPVLRARANPSRKTKRENLDDVGDAEDVWKRGYGDGTQITWLFLALVRAAGFEADPCWSRRATSYFFDPRLMNSAAAQFQRGAREARRQESVSRSGHTLHALRDAALGRDRA